MTDLTYMNDAIAAFEEGHTVHHVRHPEGRSAAIRPTDGDEHAYRLDLSDGHKIETLRGLDKWEASDVLNEFVDGTCVIVDDRFALLRMEINQGMRDVDPVQWNAKRVRLEYEMPNRGLMQGWWHYVTLAHTRCIMPKHVAERIRHILKKHGETE